ncbi:phospholipase A2, membrane associated [Cynocephalus volans]|uniref:phospholipase A2, membrane associated n=1 Tax=Cynocephalus volans TaxID=110931 RepID=UPI002FC5EB04
MKTLLLLAVIMAFGLLQTHGNLRNFGQMIWLATGKKLVLDYGFYGCHCGLGGRGFPKDATDRCCAVHDCCYRHLEKLGCHNKLLSYKFSHSGGSIVCASQDYCGSQLCECDRNAANCFARNLDTYDKEYQHYSKLQCSGSAPRC